MKYQIKLTKNYNDVYKSDLYFTNAIPFIMNNKYVKDGDFDPNNYIPLYDTLAGAVGIFGDKVEKSKNNIIPIGHEILKKRTLNSGDADCTISGISGNINSICLMPHYAENVDIYENTNNTNYTKSRFSNWNVNDHVEYIRKLDTENKTIITESEDRSGNTRKFKKYNIPEPKFGLDGYYYNGIDTYNDLFLLDNEFSWDNITDIGAALNFDENRQTHEIDGYTYETYNVLLMIAGQEKDSYLSVPIGSTDKAIYQSFFAHYFILTVSTYTYNVNTGKYIYYSDADVIIKDGRAYIQKDRDITLNNILRIMKYDTTTGTGSVIDYKDLTRLQARINLTKDWNYSAMSWEDQLVKELSYGKDVWCAMYPCGYDKNNILYMYGAKYDSSGVYSDKTIFKISNDDFSNPEKIGNYDPIEMAKNNKKQGKYIYYSDENLSNFCDVYNGICNFFGYYYNAICGIAHFDNIKIESSDTIVINIIATDEEA